MHSRAPHHRVAWVKNWVLNPRAKGALRQIFACHGRKNHGPSPSAKVQAPCRRPRTMWRTRTRTTTASASFRVPRRHRPRAVARTRPRGGASTRVGQSTRGLRRRMPMRWGTSFCANASYLLFTVGSLRPSLKLCYSVSGALVITPSLAFFLFPFRFLFVSVSLSFFNPSPSPSHPSPFRTCTSVGTRVLRHSFASLCSSYSSFVVRTASLINCAVVVATPHPPHSAVSPV